MKGLIEHIENENEKGNFEWNQKVFKGRERDLFYFSILSHHIISLPLESSLSEN